MLESISFFFKQFITGRLLVTLLLLNFFQCYITNILANNTLLEYIQHSFSFFKTIFNLAELKSKCYMYLYISLKQFIVISQRYSGSKLTNITTISSFFIYVVQFDFWSLQAYYISSFEDNCMKLINFGTNIYMYCI